MVYANTQIHKYKYKKYKYIKYKYIKYKYIKYKYTNTNTQKQIHKYTNTQIHKCTNTQMQGGKLQLFGGKTRNWRAKEGNFVAAMMTRRKRRVDFTIFLIADVILNNGI